MQYPLRRLVSGAQKVNHSEEEPSSNKIVTPANIMTASRALALGPWTAKRLIQGKRGALPLFALVAASDAEGNVARWVDKHYPNSGRGITKGGRNGDPIADTIAFGEVALGGLAAPNVSKLGKLALLLVLGTEARKAVWANRVRNEYKEATGQELRFPDVTEDAKLATLEKFIAEGTAVASSETQRPLVKAVLGAVALGFACSGSYRGEQERQGYDEQIRQAIATYTPSVSITDALMTE